MICTMYLPHF